MEPRDTFSTFFCAMKATCLAACLIEQTINLLNNYINIYSNNNDEFSTELVTFSYILCYFVNAWDGTSKMSLFFCPTAAEQKKGTAKLSFLLVLCTVTKNTCPSPNDDVSIMKVSPQGHLLHLFPCIFTAILYYVNVLKPSRCLVEWGIKPDTPLMKHSIDRLVPAVLNI